MIAVVAVCVAVILLKFDDFERRWIKLHFKAAALLVTGVDFVAAVIDLDALDLPALFFCKCFNSVARLPIADWNITIIVPCLGICGGSNGERKCRNSGFHHVFLSSVKACFALQPDGRLTEKKNLLQLPVRLRVDLIVRAEGRFDMRVLLIEDDTALGAAVRDQIAADGHSVDWVTRLDNADDALAAAAFDLVLLDLMLPDGLGIPFLKRLRARGEVTPVIILTALDQVTDRIAGLNAGADDYLVKPFDLAELSARIGSVARRYTGNPNPNIRLGPLEIDLAGRSVLRDGKAVTLTAREWVMFEAFVQHPGQLHSKAQLEERLYSFDTEVESNAIEVHVSRLRKKLGSGVIETERGLGYRLGRM